MSEVASASHPTFSKKCVYKIFATKLCVNFVLRHKYGFQLSSQRDALVLQRDALVPQRKKLEPQREALAPQRNLIVLQSHLCLRGRHFSLKKVLVPHMEVLVHQT